MWFCDSDSLAEIEVNRDKLRGGRPQSAPSDWRLIAFGETLGRTKAQSNPDSRTESRQEPPSTVLTALMWPDHFMQSWTRTETISCQHREWHAQCFQLPPLRMPHLSLHTSHLFTVKPRRCPSVWPVKREGGLKVLFNVCHKKFSKSYFLCCHGLIKCLYVFQAWSHFCHVIVYISGKQHAYWWLWLL